MKRFSKLIILFSIISMVFSLTTFQFGEEKRMDLKQKPVIAKSRIPVMMLSDIRGKWKLMLTWTMEPPTWEWTFTFTGTRTAGTFKGIQKTHGHEWIGTYSVSGKNVTFNQDPSTIDNSGTGFSFPLNSTGNFLNKDKMKGTFKCGPDGGTWTAFRKILMKIPVKKRLIPKKKPIIEEKK